MGGIFWHPFSPDWGPPSLLYSGYSFSFRGINGPWCGVGHITLSSAETEERIELCFHSPSGLHGLLYGESNYTFRLIILENLKPTITKTGLYVRYFERSTFFRNIGMRLPSHKQSCPRTCQYLWTWSVVSSDLNIQQQRCENFKSRKIYRR